MTVTSSSSSQSHLLASLQHLPHEWLDRFLGSDPGFNRLRSAGQAVAAIGMTMLAEWLFIRFTGAMQTATTPGMSAKQVAAVEVHNGAVEALGMLLGGLISMISTFGSAMFPKPRTALLSLSLMPVPMIAGLSIGLGLSPIPPVAMAAMVAVLALGGYLRRFGPPGFLGGQLLFVGSFVGFILSRIVDITALGWLAIAAFIGAGMAILAQFTLFYPSRRTALRRLRRSIDGRIGQVMVAALDYIDDPGDQRKRRKVHRLLIRLNETTLMADAQLADPAAIPPGATAAAIHQRMFDGELASSNTARFAVRIGEYDLPRFPLQLVRTTLRAIEDQQPERVIQTIATLRQWLDTRCADSDCPVAVGARHSGSTTSTAGPPEHRCAAALDRTQRIVMHRFTTSSLDVAEMFRSVRDDPNPAGVPDTEDFDPAVSLTGGFLPGTSDVSATASTERGTQLLDRPQLQSHSRIAIQMAVSVAGAILFGSVLDQQRFYWAVIAAFATFLGAHNAAEQLRKTAHRVIGTLVGVFVGAVLVHIIGNHVGWSITAILISVFIGIYLLRISYAVMVIAITIMVSQLYVRLHQFSTELLLLRLGETAIGAACAALTVLFVVPVRARHVVRVAAREQLQALRELIMQAIQRLHSDSDEINLRPAARQLDAAFQALDAITAPSRNQLPGVSGAGLREQYGYAMTAVRHYARNLVVDTEDSDRVPAELDEQLADAGKLLITSLDTIIAAIDAGRDFDQYTYLRSAALFERLATELNDSVTAPRQLSLRDLQLINGALAALARSIGMEVQGLDTTPSPGAKSPQPVEES